MRRCCHYGLVNEMLVFVSISPSYHVLDNIMKYLQENHTIEITKKKKKRTCLLVNKITFIIVAVIFTTNVVIGSYYYHNYY